MENRWKEMPNATRSTDDDDEEEEGEEQQREEKKRKVKRVSMHLALHQG